MSTIGEVGILCESCSWKNTGTSQDCQNCGHKLIDDLPMSEPRLSDWTERQLLLRSAKGLAADSDAEDALRAWAVHGHVVEKPRETPSPGTVTTEPPTQQQAATTERADSYSPRSEKLLEAILTILRGLALFLILSIISTIFATWGLVVQANDRFANTAFFFLIAAASSIGAIVSLVWAFSESGNFKK